MANFKYKDYEESDEVKRRREALKRLQEGKPSEFKSHYSDLKNNALNSYNNRDKFKFDLNADALYQMYKNGAIANGQMAMKDTMGRASQLTGGYGNSYANMVGNQAYQKELSKLNDVVPELYQIARNNYDKQGNEMLNQYQMYADLERQDYGKYRDDLNQWERDRNYATNQLENEKANDLNEYNRLKEEAYNKYITENNIRVSGGGGKSNYGDIDKILEKAYQLGGEHDMEGLDAYLTMLTRRGIISEDEALELYDMFVTKDAPKMEGFKYF